MIDSDFGSGLFSDPPNSKSDVPKNGRESTEQPRKGDPVSKERQQEGRATDDTESAAITSETSGASTSKKKRKSRKKAKKASGAQAEVTTSGTNEAGASPSEASSQTDSESSSMKAASRPARKRGGASRKAKEQTAEASTSDHGAREDRELDDRDDTDHDGADHDEASSEATSQPSRPSLRESRQARREQEPAAREADDDFDDDEERSEDDEDQVREEGDGDEDRDSASGEARRRRRRGSRGRRDREDREPRATTEVDDVEPRESRAPRREHGPSKAQAAAPLPKRHSNTQRVAVLVDCQSLDSALEEHGHGRLAPIGLLEQTTDGRPRARAIAYLAEASRARTEVLRGAGFDTVLVVPDETERLISMALDAAAAARRADTVVIASENPRLAPVAIHLRALGVRCEFASFDPELFAETEASGSTLLALGDDSRLVP